jgi:predicted HAD superfamily phosphohydrolase YqeG
MRLLRADALQVFDYTAVVPFELLDTQQIAGSTIILDLDGTIVADARSEISADIWRAVQGLAFRNAVYIFSNHSNGVRNREIARRLGVEYLSTRHRKPSKKIIQAIPIRDKARPMIVVGDKITIDGLFARRIGAQFIKVDRVVAASDRRSVKVAYLVDDMVSILATLFGKVLQPPMRRRQC